MPAAASKSIRSPHKSSKTPPGNSSDPVTAWAEAVVAGELIVGPHVRNACRRHLLDLVEGAARGLTWDLEAALWSIDFFRVVLRLNGGQFEGLPFELQPSQVFKTGSMFGWKRADGSRRFRRAYIEEGKGGGKSPWAAGLGMYCLLADGEARAEVYAAASKKDQAMILFRDAVAMYEQSPALFDRLHKSGGEVVPWNLSDAQTSSFFRPISSDDSQSGPRPHCALLDELHEHRDGRMVEMLERGFKWRRQPLIVMITNSGSDRNSVCWEEHQHAVRVAAGTMAPDADYTFVGEPIDDQTFAFVCALDKDDDPLEDPTCWVKTNPLLGITVQHDYLATVVKQAKQIPGKQNGILRLHFCVWTESDAAWMSRPALEACLADFDPGEHYGKPCNLGLDLSATRDLTALAFMVQTGMKTVERQADTGLIHVVQAPMFDLWVEAWTPRDTIAARALQDQAPYDVWAQQGWLTDTPGSLVRYDIVAARVAEAANLYEVKSLAYDAYAFRKQFVPALDEAGCTVPIVEHPQGGKRKAAESGLWMPGSVSALEALILEGRVRILRSPVTISAFMSGAIESDAFDNRWFSKRKATNRIDPLVAAAIATGAATAGRDAVSTYNRKELLIL